MAVIECRSLEKRYGKVTAVKDLSFQVEEGELVGFVGPNGAGKTSTLKIMVGLSTPSSGEVLLSGKKVTPVDNHTALTAGYMPDDPAFPAWMTPLQHLRFLGKLFSRDSEAVRKEAEALVELFGLEHLKNRKVGGFSKGERQRLALAHALTGEPRVLIMDEPTSGLDPIGRRELLDYIKSLAGDMTILFSTHLLADVDRVCDRVVMIDKGRKIADDSISALKNRYSEDAYLIQVDGNEQALLERLNGSSWCKSASLGGNGIELKVHDMETASRETPALVADLGIGIELMEAVKYNLEDVFMRVLSDYDASGVTD